MSIYTKSRKLADRLIDKFANEKLATIERRQDVSDGQGGVTGTWVTLFSDMQCAVIPMSGSEVVDAQRLNYTATHNAYFRYSDISGVQSDDRIVFDGRVFAIRDPRNIAEANAAYKVRCEEGAGS